MHGRQQRRLIPSDSGVKRQRGAVAIMVAVSSVMLLGFGALAIDVANVFVVRNELQNAADAAAMAGAGCLYPRAACGNPGATGPDWATASSKANTGIGLNQSEKLTLTNGTVEYGYWNPTGTSGLQSLPFTPGPNDLPAVRVTIQKASGLNNGAVTTFFAGLFGVNSVPISATATAVVSRPGYVGPGGLFPVAISSCLFDNYWDSANNRPQTASSTAPLENTDWAQVVGDPYTFKITSSYHAGPCEAGQWTTFEDDINNVPAVRALIDDGNDDALSTALDIWIQPGTKTTLYDSVNSCSAAGDGSCEYVVVPVIDNISTHSYQPVVGFACIRILLAEGGSDKYIKVQMSNDADRCQARGSGGFSGESYGAYTPPRLVQ